LIERQKVNVRRYPFLPTEQGSEQRTYDTHVELDNDVTTQLKATMEYTW